MVQLADDVVEAVTTHVGMRMQQHRGGPSAYLPRPRGREVARVDGTVATDGEAEDERRRQAPDQDAERSGARAGQRPEGERRTTGGILIPATAQMSKRLAWAEVVATGPNVRNMEPGDQVLFNPEDLYEVEVRGEDFVILRERDVHAVASKRLEEGSTGLYL